MKRIASALLTMALLVSSLVFPVYAKQDVLIAPNPNSAKSTNSDVFLSTFKTCYDPTDYLQIDIDGNTLELSGRLRNEEVKYLCVPFNGDNVVITLLHGSRFTASFDLSRLTDKEYEFTVYTGKSLTGDFISAFYGRDIVLENRNGIWGVSVNKSVYDSNQAYMSGWMDEKSALSINVPDRIKRAAENITSGLETDYDKARAIHEYVADTVYYDMDYAMHISPSTYVTAEDVYDKGIAVCEGYTNLTVALLRSVGIPAVFIDGYATGIGRSVSMLANADLTSANHAWVEAYIDGRWIVMDPTWDSKNTLENGKKNTMHTDFFRFFDVTPELLSTTHYIISRPNAFGKTGVSSWALDEAKTAYRYGLITTDCLKSMPDAITRLEFCDLVVNMLTVKLGKSIQKILADKNLTVNQNAFSDTDYYNILAANALGIVNGKEGGKFDPNGTIKRQEAAAMLQRAAVNVLGVEKANSASVAFADAKSFADWGRDAIAFVSASVDKNGMRVMGGKENNNFAPNDLYTKEQSVLTILRLYTAY